MMPIDIPVGAKLLAPQFDPVLALRLAQVCSRSYHESSLWARNTDAEALVLDEPDAITVAFPGSHSIKDWLQDGKFWQTKTWGGCVHAGFADDTNSLIVALQGRVRDLIARDTTRPGRRPILLTGHSLGAALAILAGEILKRQGFAVTAVYTFGEPRVGNASFAGHYNALLGSVTFRVANEYDLVPHVPLPGLILCYEHHETEVLLKESGGFVIARSLARKLCTDGLMLYQAWRLLRAPLDLWDDVKAYHEITTYITRLQVLPAPNPRAKTAVSAP